MARLVQCVSVPFTTPLPLEKTTLNIPIHRIVIIKDERTGHQMATTVRVVDIKIVSNILSRPIHRLAPFPIENTSPTNTDLNIQHEHQKDAPPIKKHLSLNLQHFYVGIIIIIKNFKCLFFSYLCYIIHVLSLFVSHRTYILKQNIRA